MLWLSPSAMFIITIGRAGPSLANGKRKNARFFRGISDMFDYLAGKVVEKTPVSVVLDVSGVGYHIFVPVSTSAVLPPAGESVRLRTHFVVREDAHVLYGFASDEERQMFRLLLSVSGIGPKSAITVLSGKSISELKQAIINGSLLELTTIPGIGKKTAERIIVELREKVVLEERTKPSVVSNASQAEESLIEDSIRALVELGYRKQNAKEAIQRVLKDADNSRLTVAELIRASLKYV
jgi:holliday junction DNA helicase RuvA